MSEVIVYGFSDDLIEVEGEINQEFYLGTDEGGYLAFSDGTLLRVDYDGDWNISLKASGKSSYHNEPPADNGSDYSDIVTLTGDFKWVLFGGVGSLGRREE